MKKKIKQANICKYKNITKTFLFMDLNYYKNDPSIII